MKKALALLLSLFVAAPALSGQSILPAPMRVSEHVYAWIGPHGPPRPENNGFRMNLAFVVGDKSVAVLESGYSPAMAKDMLAHMARVTDSPVRYVINSNSRPDRYFGNDVFDDNGATIIAHELEVQQMKAMVSNHATGAEMAMGAAQGEIGGPRMPSDPIASPMSIDLGGHTIRVIPFVAAHTPAPLVVHVPADNVVYAGDILYSGRLPAVVPGGNAASWPEAFKALAQFGDATIVPGHGDPARLSGFRHSTYDYLVALNEHMAKAVDEGLDLQDAIASLDQSAWQYLADFDALASRNAHRVYIEQEAAAFE